MSWNGTVYCGYCGQKGHNRVSCPERKAEALRNPGGWTANQLKKEADRRKSKPRACSYCREPGHNRSTCKVLKDDKSKLLSDVAHFRLRFLKNLKNAGLGIGALVSTPSLARVSSGCYTSMITDIDWNYVDTLCASHHTSDIPRRGIFRGIIANVPQSTDFGWRTPTPGEKAPIWTSSLHSLMKDCIDNHKYAQTEVLVKSSKGISPPEGWLNPSEDDLGNYFWESWNIYPPKGADEWSKRRNTSMWDQRQERIDDGRWA